MKAKKLKISVVILMAAIVAIAVLSFGTTAFAETESKTVQDIMLEQFSGEEREILTNKDYYNDWFEEDIGFKVEDFDYNSAPVLKVYKTYDWSKADKPIEELAVEYDNDNYFEYLVFQNDILRLRAFFGEEKTGVTLCDVYGECDKIPDYIKDLADNNFPFDLRNVTNIYCFDVFAREKVLYFVGEDTNVVYYETDYSSAHVFTFEEFAEKGIEYYNYISSYEHNYDKDGNALILGYDSLANYLTNEPSVNPDAGVPLYKNPILWIGIVLGACVVCTVTVIIVKERKSKNN